MMPITPEPWTWCGTDPGYQDFETGRWEDPPQPAAVIAGEGDAYPDEHTVIAWANNTMSPEEQEANVKLMHAAPKLYSFVREHLDAVCYCEYPLSNTPGNKCRVCRAHDLVNLVEGGAPSGG